ncbi:MAG: hypothetical protein HC869_12530 [Rhodospirillales bacterium]|nr:hypothetical protein [Rhodospirillales bacterium]
MRASFAAKLGILSLAAVGLFLAGRPAFAGDPAAKPDLASARKLILYWDVPRDVVALTDGGLVPIIRYPADIRTFGGTPAENQLMLGVSCATRTTQSWAIATSSRRFRSRTT